MEKTILKTEQNKTIKVGKETQPSVAEVTQMPVMWKGWKNKGLVNYTNLTALKEIINNVIQNKKLVNLQVVIDTVIDTMWVTDDMCGIAADKLSGIYIGGQSYPNGTLLSEHGDGLAITTNFWGDLVYTRTSEDGFDFDEVRLDHTQHYVSMKWVQNVDPITKYSVDKKKWVDTDVPGFQTKIKLTSPPKNAAFFKNLKKGLEGAYWDYLGKNLNIEIVWLKKHKFHEHYNCKPTRMLLTKNPNNGTIDVDKMLGLDEWDYNDIYRCKKTGIVVDLKIGNVPHPDAVLAHYGQDVYDEYIQSQYCHRGDMIGVHYSKAWVPIADSKFKATSHSESLIGFINIISGIDTVQTKDAIKRPPSGIVEEFEEELKEKVFKKHGFYVRAQTRYHKISEAEMEKTLLDLLQNNATVRNIMGFNDKNVFDKRHTSVNGGVPDIIAYKDKTKVDVDAVLEIKKEGNDRLWKGLAQGFSYSEGLKSKRLILVAQDKELSTQMKSKILPHERVMRLAYPEEMGDFSIKYFQYQRLVDMALKYPLET